MIDFTLDGRAVAAEPGETIWQAARRHGVEIPHLCHRPRPGYRADGNCRACMVEVDGERALVASCIRTPREGMVVHTDSERVVAARRMVFELLLADQKPEPGTPFAAWCERLGLAASRLPATHRPPPPLDTSHRAISVNLTACIHCTLCVRACREVQVNDVIAMAGRGAATRVAFDQGDPMGASTCVACGECVQACPTGALLPAAAQARTVPEREVDSLCPYCGVGCQVRYGVSGGRIVAASGRDGPANRERLCVKGRYGFDYAHHRERLTVPLIRRDDAPKDAQTRVDAADPSSHFRPATWDEALDHAAAGFARILRGHGPAALAGFGSAKGSNEEAYLFQKLVRTAFRTNNVDHCTRLCHASSVAALMEGIGSGAVTAPVDECLNAEVILLVGANPAVNHPVAATFIKNAVRRGARLIVMDPRGQALARHASFVLRNRPGSDVAVLGAMMHTILAEGLHDRAFIEARTEGFDALNEHLQSFSPEAMAEVCGIGAATLRDAARLFGRAKRAMIFWGMGISQHVHGTDNARCLIALAMLCGQVGRPGTGLHPLRGQNNVQGASDSGLIPMVYPDYRSVEDEKARAFYESLWGMPLDPQRGLTVVEILHAAAAGSLKGLYIMGENPAMSDPDLDHARAGLAALDHLVVQDIFLTETAWHADVVLPATSFFEKDGTYTNTDRRVQLGRAVVEPPGEARADAWIICEMARRLGQDWPYGGVRDVFDELRTCIAGWAGITWERLERDGAVTYPCPDAQAPGRSVLFSDTFPTPSGRARLVPAHIVPPDETPDDDYPMVLSTGRVLEHWHTGAMTRRAAVLDALEPGAVAFFAPADLMALGIAPGERARLVTRRGSVEVTARADGDMARGLVFAPFCFAEGPANRLTNPALDPDGKIPEFKYCAVRAEAV